MNFFEFIFIFILSFFFCVLKEAPLKTSGCRIIGRHHNTHTHTYYTNCWIVRTGHFEICTSTCSCYLPAGWFVRLRCGWLMSILQWQVALSYHTHTHTHKHTYTHRSLWGFVFVPIIPTVPLKVKCKRVNYTKKAFEEIQNIVELFVDFWGNAWWSTYFIYLSIYSFNYLLFFLHIIFKSEHDEDDVFFLDKFNTVYIISF